MGSNPMSPGMEPSNFSGRTKKGIDLDISSAFKATLPARAYWEAGAKAEADATKRERMADFIMVLLILLILVCDTSARDASDRVHGGPLHPLLLLLLSLDCSSGQVAVQDRTVT
mmetsp:Transcript_35709/g.102890  ORF Transcript_35709/g.102890 Transcript_35709/m.102890 type:complete len:114 (-) Transcript_35709:239-580(-)